jgi:heme oxygenase
VYRAYLARLLGFYAPVEAALGARAWAPAGLDFEARRKVPLLVADLVSLGLAEGAQAALPRCAEIPGLPDLPEALGCAYVLEGATRGGRVLSRLAGEALGVTRARGCAFLTGYGDAGDAMWQAFRRGVEAAVPDEGTGARVLAAARETFALLQRWLEAGEARPAGP